MSNSRALALPIAQPTYEAPVRRSRIPNFGFALRHIAARASEMRDAVGEKMEDAKDHLVAFTLAAVLVGLPVGLMVLSNMSSRSYGM